MKNSGQCLLLSAFQWVMLAANLESPTLYSGCAHMSKPIANDICSEWDSRSVVGK